MSASTVGILAVQGAFAAHATMLRALGHRVRLLRRAGDVDGITGLVLPGGESSVHLHHLQRQPELAEALERCVHHRRLPVLATCAGAILVASQVDPHQEALGWMAIHAERNAYGPQIASACWRDDADTRDLVMIRAPKLKPLTSEVRVLATWRGDPVLLQQGRLVAASFHPELGRDLSLHGEVFGRAVTRAS